MTIVLFNYFLLFNVLDLCSAENFISLVFLQEGGKNCGGFQSSLRSWRDLVRECFCFGCEAVNASGEAVRGLVKSRVEFPPAQIHRVF